MLWHYLDGLPGPGLTLVSGICLGIHSFPPDIPDLLSISFVVGSDDFYRTFHPKTKEYNFFSVPHVTFSKINHIMGLKASLNIYKKIEILPCILSDHHGLRLVFNNNKNNKKPTYTWKLNNPLLNDSRVKEKIKKEIKDFIEFNENESTTYPILWDATKAVLRGKLIALSASKKKLRRAYTSGLTAQLKALEQKEADTPKRSRWQEVNSEVNSTKYKE